MSALIANVVIGSLDSVCNLDILRYLDIIGHSLEKEGLKLDQDGFDGVGGTPSLVNLFDFAVQHIQAKGVSEHIWMRNRSVQRNLRWGARIVPGDLHLEVEDASLPFGACWSSEVTVPGVHIIWEWFGTDTDHRLSCLHQLL